MAHAHEHHAAPSQSKYGYSGNFSIPPYLRHVADHYDLQVTRSRDGKGYLVRSAHGHNALARLLEPFSAEEGVRAEKDGIVLDKASLKNVLSFLHQPLRYAAEACVQANEPDLKRREKAAKIDAQRRAMHSLLRFATLSNADLPLHHDNSLDKEVCECHADVENKLKEDDLWALEIEIGNPENHGDHDHIVSAIPASHYDARRGFVFKLHPDFIHGDDALEGKNQQALRREFQARINAVTGGRYKTLEEELVLSTQELCDLSDEVAKADLQPLIENSRFERRVQNALGSIAEDAQSLSGNMNFQRSLSVKNETGAQDQKVQDLLRASSSLKPLLAPKRCVAYGVIINLPTASQGWIARWMRWYPKWRLCRPFWKSIKQEAMSARQKCRRFPTALPMFWRFHRT